MCTKGLHSKMNSALKRHVSIFTCNAKALCMQAPNLRLNQIAIISRAWCMTTLSSQHHSTILFRQTDRQTDWIIDYFINPRRKIAIYSKRTCFWTTFHVHLTNYWQIRANYCTSEVKIYSGFTLCVLQVYQNYIVAIKISLHSGT